MLGYVSSRRLPQFLLPGHVVLSQEGIHSLESMFKKLAQGLVVQSSSRLIAARIGQLKFPGTSHNSQLELLDFSWQQMGTCKQVG